MFSSRNNCFPSLILILALFSGPSCVQVHYHYEEPDDIGEAADLGEMEDITAAGIDLQFQDDTSEPTGEIPAEAQNVGDGLPLLGGGNHLLSSVEFTTINQSEIPLIEPRDLAFNPDNPSELWIVCQGDESMVLYHDINSDPVIATKYIGIENQHYMAQPSGLSFGQTGTVATIHETDQVTQVLSPRDFMGPSLHSTEAGVFDGGWAGHIDMLHNSPLGMGITWERDNIFWVFDGYHNAISRYNFHQEHEPGGQNDTDGEIARFVEGQVAREAGIPSHLAFDATSQLLYIADTGNHRIAVLDTTSGHTGGPLIPNYNNADQYFVDDALLWTLGTGIDLGLVSPSGILLTENILYVTDNVTSRISAFSLEGDLLDWLETDLPSGSLMGLEIGADGLLYLVDVVADQIHRISPL